MIKFDYYYFKEENDPKLFITIDWFKYDDRWHQLYIGYKPLYPPEEMVRLKQKNRERCRWFRFSLSLSGLRIHIDFKLKLIKNLLHGRLVDEDKEAERVKRKLDKTFYKK